MFLKKLFNENLKYVNKMVNNRFMTLKYKEAPFPTLTYPTYHIKLSTHSSKPYQISNCFFHKYR